MDQPKRWTYQKGKSAGLLVSYYLKNLYLVGCLFSASLKCEKSLIIEIISYIPPRNDSYSEIINKNLRRNQIALICTQQITAFYTRWSHILLVPAVVLNFHNSFEVWNYTQYQVFAVSSLEIHLKTYLLRREMGMGISIWVNKLLCCLRTCSTSWAAYYISCSSSFCL